MLLEGADELIDKTDQAGAIVLEGFLPFPVPVGMGNDECARFGAHRAVLLQGGCRNILEHRGTIG
jgi:hypothetical protein